MLRPAWIALIVALPATAQEVPDRDAARDALFGTRAIEVTVTRHDFMTDLDVATLQSLPQAAELQYYGALAVPPADGLQSEAARGAFNYHRPADARQAALAECNAVKSGGPDCVIVAEIRPQGWEDGRALSLNQEASAAVRSRAFNRAGRAAALAISPSTGMWGLADGWDAAIADCGAADCAVVVAR